MKIPFREFMPLECIKDHAEFYASQGDFHAAAYCIKEGLEQNQDKEDNWGLHYSSGGCPRTQRSRNSISSWHISPT